MASTSNLDDPRRHVRLEAERVSGVSSLPSFEEVSATSCSSFRADLPSASTCFVCISGRMVCRSLAPSSPVITQARIILGIWTSSSRSVWRALFPSSLLVSAWVVTRKRGDQSKPTRSYPCSHKSSSRLCPSWLLTSSFLHPPYHPSTPLLTPIPTSFPSSPLEQNLQVKIHSLSDSTTEFDLVGLDSSLANALRRIMIAEVPTIAIEDVYVYTNTSIVQDEVLAHRLGMIPLNIEPRHVKMKTVGESVGVWSNAVGESKGELERMYERWDQGSK
jgi:hypothetical protein